MTTDAQLLAGVATIGASWSMAWNTAAAIRITHRAFRLTFAVSAVLSAVFVVAWGIIAVHPNVDRQVWSEAVTPFSLLSFFVVWSAPPLLHIAAAKRPLLEGSEGNRDE